MLLSDSWDSGNLSSIWRFGYLKFIDLSGYLSLFVPFPDL
jgi:hypothetical protein